MHNKKVVVAMSGGVDSSVSAYLLKKAGYDVIGVFIRFWSPDDRGKSLCNYENLCCSAEAKEVAEKTARFLDIPFYVLDARDFFKEKIVNYFIKEYFKGKTPNPCVMCGKYIKFDFLHNKAIKIFDADYIATGHYVRTKKVKDNYFLLKGKDRAKDQSYFLYTANQKVLPSFIFPIGDMEKSDVRKIARNAKLPSYERPESQEICFVPNNDYADFLNKHSKKSFKRGWIVDTKGNRLKEHQGIHNFTIGQRRGIGISNKLPYYVVSINAKMNEVIVGFENDLLSKKILIEKVNWISNVVPKDGSVLDVKIRYSMEAQKAKVCKKDKYIEVDFLKPVRAATPGQSAVFYKGDIVVGGGIIR